MKQRQLFLTLLSAISLGASACGQLDFEIVEPTPIVDPTATLGSELAGETKIADDGVVLVVEPTEQFSDDPCATSPNDLEAFACAMQNNLLSRDFSALEKSMSDPFTIGYWQSEGRSNSPSNILEELFNGGLPADSTLPLTFTTDRELFPPLFGIPAESLMHPDLNIVSVIYSEGWGSDGAGAALLYITESVVGEYVWESMAIAGQHFDKPNE